MSFKDNIKKLEQITFGEIKSYDHFGLILAKKTIELPTPKTDSVSTLYMHGEYDYTEAFNNTVYYNNRNLSFEFIYPKDKDADFDNLMSVLTKFIHGKKMNVYVGEDIEPYVGRVTINEISSDRLRGKVKIDVNANPFRGNDADIHYLDEVLEINNQYMSVPNSMIKKIGNTSSPVFRAEGARAIVRFYTYSGRYTSYANDGTDTFLSNIIVSKGIEIRTVNASDVATVKIGKQFGGM